MQRKWAAHNSAYVTLKKGRKIVYKAPCDYDRLNPKKPKVKMVPPALFDLIS